ncbi:unnamed protein product [marine sediment metagenome]|uniref:Uncharacterized protein n=1 Tax=marine sediment metagenome TaxID=412755 RepID=X1Q1Q9_9ZZZZ
MVVAYPSPGTFLSSIYGVNVGIAVSVDLTIGGRFPKSLKVPKDFYTPKFHA